MRKGSAPRRRYYGKIMQGQPAYDRATVEGVAAFYAAEIRLLMRRRGGAGLDARGYAVLSREIRDYMDRLHELKQIAAGLPSESDGDMHYLTSKERCTLLRLFVKARERREKQEAEAAQAGTYRHKVGTKAAQKTPPGTRAVG